MSTWRCALSIPWPPANVRIHVLSGLTKSLGLIGSTDFWDRLHSQGSWPVVRQLCWPFLNCSLFFSLFLKKNLQNIICRSHGDATKRSTALLVHRGMAACLISSFKIPRTLRVRRTRVRLHFRQSASLACRTMFLAALQTHNTFDTLFKKVAQKHWGAGKVLHLFHRNLLYYLGCRPVSHMTHASKLRDTPKVAVHSSQSASGSRELYSRLAKASAADLQI
jgi:hypothetical protein